LNKFTIRPDAARELDKIVEIMNKYSDMIVELGSHTDCRASEQYNLTLSDKRAKASAAYIKAKITNPERIYGKGYGESKLINDCACEGTVKSDCTEEEHAANRRTEFKVISTDGANVKK
jgi:outer membrane protein OmpA-like peptidoglycan-associated protein